MLGFPAMLSRTQRRSDAHRGPLTFWLSVIGAVAGLAMFADAAGSGDYVEAALGLSLVLSVHLLGLRPRLVLGPDAATVVNVVRQWQVPYGQVESAQAERTLTLRLRDRAEPVRVYAVQKANAAMVTGAESQVDRVAREIEARAESATAGSSTTSRLSGVALAEVVALLVLLIIVFAS